MLMVEPAALITPRMLLSLKQRAEALMMDATVS